MARRATFIKENSKKADFSLLVDAGGFSRGVAEESRLKVNYLMRGLDWLNYAAINLGYKDFLNGGEYLKQLVKDKNFRFLSANVYYKGTNKRFTKPYIIKKIRPNPQVDKKLPFKSIKVGIIGLCDERKTLFNSNNIDEPMLEARDPLPEAQELVNKVRGKADIVVLLYYGRFAKLRELLDAVEGVDLVVVGGEYYRVDRMPQRETLVVSTPSLGKYIGVVTLTLDRKKKIVSKVKSRYPLNEKIEDDPKFVKLVQEFEKEAQQLRRAKISQKSKK